MTERILYFLLILILIIIGILANVGVKFIVNIQQGNLECKEIVKLK